MDYSGTISAVNNALSAFAPSTGANAAEAFAIKRFFSKYERPSSAMSTSRRITCWDSWLANDSLLGWKHLYTPNWAVAKLFIAKVLKDFHLGPVSFTNGSEFTPTYGYGSIESKLSRSKWTCTPDNFEFWCRTCYGVRALKFAMRKRFAKLLVTKAWDRRRVNKRIWETFRKTKDPAFSSFCFKLSLVTEMVQGNRFSTVPKNNSVDRPICIEPLANILTQRRIGQGIRGALKLHGLDLDTAANIHRSMISAPKYATVDLKNASDSISLSLVEYLIPYRVLKLIKSARSEMTLGLDGEFYLIKKVSSMGNGFTFELMSLILFALCKSLTQDCSVFGDDIIVPNNVAETLVRDLNNGGFVVNPEKSHIYDVYRESCGAHFLDGHGYVESYDFRWAKNIGEVLTISNKLSRLANIYPSFRSLFTEVYRAMPATLYAENPHKIEGIWHRPQEPFGSPKLDTFTVMSPYQFRKDGIPMTRSAKGRLRRFCRNLQLNPRDASMHYGVEWVDAGSIPSTVDATRQWAKILMYLSSSRRCADTVKGKGVFKSFKVVTLCHGTTFRWSEIVAAT